MTRIEDDLRHCADQRDRLAKENQRLQADQALLAESLEKRFDDILVLQNRIKELGGRIRGLEESHATVTAERDAVYALGKTPTEQSNQIPLSQWVQTRFVHVEEFNALANRAEALAQAVSEWQGALRAHEKALVLLDDSVTNQLGHYLIASRREDATVTSGNLRAAGERLLALDVQESS